MGQCIAGMAWYWGTDAQTNNVAEAKAMVRALKVTKASGMVPHRGTLVVRGDSNLVIAFMTKAATPGKRELVVAVREAREETMGWGRRVVYQWVPREENTWADWLSNVAYKLQRDVTLPELQAL